MGRHLASRAAAEQVHPIPQSSLIFLQLISVGWCTLWRQSHKVSGYESYAIMDSPTWCLLFSISFPLPGPLTAFFPLVIILLVIQILAFPLGKIRQPRVISEVIAGIILGPTGLWCPLFLPTPRPISSLSHGSHSRFHQGHLPTRVPSFSRPHQQYRYHALPIPRWSRGRCPSHKTEWQICRPCFRPGACCTTRSRSRHRCPTLSHLRP